MTRVRVKICGITRAEDARLAADLGADAIGFVFWPRSPRAVAAEEAGRIAAELPPLVTRVGVFVNAAPEAVQRTVRDVGLDVVQLHGDESAAAYAAVGARLVKAVRLAGAADLDVAALVPPNVTVMVDAIDRDWRGGTGERANWTLASELACRRPIWLAGGLTAGNVGEAIRRVRPSAVDVSSGVESAPGVKDRDRLVAFLGAVARAQAEE